MSQEYTPVTWVDEAEGTVGTLINKARLDQMQTAHHYADGFEEVDTIPTADPGVDYHKVVFCIADTTFYRWNGTQWVKDVDDDTKALLLAHEADHANPHVVTKAQVGLGNVDNKGTVSTWQDTPDNDHIPTEKLVKDSLNGKVDTLVTKPTAGTYTSVTINAEGQVTGGSNPTTLAGYGIIDAVNTTGDQTGIAGAKTWTGQQTLTGRILTMSSANDQILYFKNENLTQIPNADTYIYSLAGENNVSNRVISNINAIVTNTGEVKTRLQSRDFTSGAFSDLMVSSDGYATAPSRTYNSANTSDIVTIGTLNASISIAGDKTWTGVHTYTTPLGAYINVKHPDPGSGIADYADIDHYTNNVLSNRIRMQKDGTGMNSIQLVPRNASGGYAGLPLSVTFDPGTNRMFATAPSREYNSANTSDIVNIGSLADNPSVVHPTYTRSEIQFKSIPGITITASDNNINSKCFIKCGNILIISLSITISGTYTGTSGWQLLYDFPAGTNGISAPYLVGVILSDGTRTNIHQGRYFNFTNGVTYNHSLNVQLVCSYNG